ESRHLMLHFDTGVLWGWDGTSWSIVDTAGPTDLAWSMLFYVPERQSIFVVGSTTNVFNSNVPVDALWEWNGTWTKRTTSGTDPSLFWNFDAPTPAVAYDRVRQQALVIGEQLGPTVAVAWTIDPATATWAPLALPAAPPSFNSGGDLAFDEARSVT